MTTCRTRSSAGELYTGWSQIWKKNPNLENIFKILHGGDAVFADWNCQIASWRGEMEGREYFGSGISDFGFGGFQWAGVSELGRGNRECGVRSAEFGEQEGVN